ncbi:MAG: sugar phosphate nucleotidyltransferase [Candidatus Nanohaloarchaea archaeon]|nr:sugar phosphate nucleotidyltransferase [Candidatus Nanohaloarchaea archaeon]
MAKTRVSLTLDENLVDRIDRKVDSGSYVNRSQAIERLLEEHLQRERIATAVILCGGEELPPDCMQQVDGKPALQHILDHLEEEGVERVILAINEDDQKARQHIEQNSSNLRIEYLEEEQPLGTAGALRRAKDRLEETFLLLNGDVICRVDVEDMAKTHRQDDVLGTVALTTVRDISDYGVTRLKGNKIIGFTEKPDQDEAPSNLINAGVYILEPEVIDMLPSEDEQQQVDVEDLFDQLAERRKLKGYVYEGEWRDVGN